MELAHVAPDSGRTEGVRTVPRLSVLVSLRSSFLPTQGEGWLVVLYGGCTMAGTAWLLRLVEIPGCCLVTMLLR
jgi:hypothetical protein